MPDNKRKVDEEVQMYLSESRELLDKIEPLLIEIGNNEDESNRIDNINLFFRTFHTIKGSSSFFDFVNIVSLTHQAETLLDKIRSGQIEFRSIHSDVICRTLDVLNILFNQIEKTGIDNGFEYQVDQVNAEIANLAGIKSSSEKRSSADYFVIDRNYTIFFSSAKKVIKNNSDECKALLLKIDKEIDYSYLSKLKTQIKFLEESSGLLKINIIYDICLVLTDFVKLLYDHMEVSEFEIKVIIHGFEMINTIIIEIEKEGKIERIESLCDNYLKNLNDIVAAVKKQIEESDAKVIIDIPVSKDMVELYISESLDQLDSIEENLIKYKIRGDLEILKELLRLFHNFKGGCGFMNYEVPEKTSHIIETFLDLTIKSMGVLEEKEYDSLLQAVNHLKSYVEEDNKEKYAEWLLSFNSVIKEKIEEYEVVKKEETQISLADIYKSDGKKILRQDIRVNISKLDELINLVGELVIAESLVINNPDIEGFDLENFERSAIHLDKIVKELQDVALSVRMIPVSGIFRKMIRVVHDMSRKSKKKVNLRILGEETEIDKTVAELIADPLVHLVRNSIDHGIESVNERKKNGKKETGELVLEAKHDGSEVLIIIKDDGKGLSKKNIIKKAFERGLISKETDYDEADINEIIFQPGFSTTDEITEISGRGVGLDIVKKNIDKINGRIDLFSYEKKGTMFVIRIPLTLAIIEGMIVRVGDTVYTIPLLSIKESIKAEKENITKTMDGHEMVKVREELLPVLRLHELYSHIPENYKIDEGLLIIVKHGKEMIALFVDEIIGEQQIVIKRMNKYIDKVKGVSGCSILGDGKISLILDIGGVIERSKEMGETAEIHCS